MKKTFLSELLVAERSQLSGNKLELNSGIYPVYGANGLVTYINFYEVDKPYLAVIKDGAGVGRVYKCPSKSSVLSTLQYLLPNSKIDLNYAYYWLSSLCLSKYAHGAAIPHIYYKDYKYESLLLPSLMVQKKIAERLDKVQKLIAKQKEQIAKLDLLIKSRFLDMFGDPISNPKKWVMKKLKECARTNLSYGSGAKAVNYNGTVRYIRITDIDNQGLLNKEKKSPSIFEEKYLLHQGELLFARTGATVGKTFLYDKKYGMSVYAGYLIRFVPKIDLCHPLFVFYFTHTDYYKQFVLDKQKAVAQPNINAQEYGELLIPLPPLSLQTQFTNFVKSVEQQKEVFSTRLSHLEILYKSLMQEYFG